MIGVEVDLAAQEKGRLMSVAETLAPVLEEEGKVDTKTEEQRSLEEKKDSSASHSKSDIRKEEQSTASKTAAFAIVS